MWISTFARFMTVDDSLATTDVAPISAPIDTPWYLHEIELFNTFHVPMIFIIIVVALMVVGVIFFVAQGYIKEVQRQRRKAAKAQAKAQAKAKKQTKPKAQAKKGQAKPKAKKKG
jgi:ABC-type protease/lipase transport system fused ATPase/permease subunit